MTAETEAVSEIGSGLLLATFLLELEEFGEALCELGDKLPFCLDCIVIPVLVAIPSVPSVAKPAKSNFVQKHRTKNAYNCF